MWILSGGTRDHLTVTWPGRATSVAIRTWPLLADHLLPQEEPATPLGRSSTARQRGRSGAQVCENRENAAMVVGRAGDPQLAEDAVDVALDRLRAEHQLLADAVVRAPFGHQAEHLALACGELVERAVVASPSKQLAHHLGIDGGASGGDAVDRLHEVVDGEHTVLEQVAETV